MQMLYQRAITRLEAGKPVTKWLFDLTTDLDGSAVQSLERTVRVLLRREEVSPSQISSLAKLLLGLQRLPFITPGLDVHLSLSARYEDEGHGWDVYLREGWFCLEWAGWVRGPCGTDSISGDPFEASPGSGACGSLWELDWVRSMPDLAEWAEVQLEDNSQDSRLDWEHDDGGIFEEAMMSTMGTYWDEQPIRLPLDLDNQKQDRGSV